LYARVLLKLFAMKTSLAAKQLQKLWIQVFLRKQRQGAITYKKEFDGKRHLSILRQKQPNGRQASAAAKY
jgi:hypothetical protein